MMLVFHRAWTMAMRSEEPRVAGFFTLDEKFFLALDMRFGLDIPSCTWAAPGPFIDAMTMC